MKTWFLHSPSSPCKGFVHSNVIFLVILKWKKNLCCIFWVDSAFYITIIKFAKSVTFLSTRRVFNLMSRNFLFTPCLQSLVEILNFPESYIILQYNPPVHYNSWTRKPALAACIAWKPLCQAFVESEASTHDTGPGPCSPDLVFVFTTLETKTSLVSLREEAFFAKNDEQWM